MIVTPSAVPPPTSSPPRPTTTPTSTTNAPSAYEQEHRLALLKIPSVILSTPAISHTMAAALALSLLGHVLFLKSQIPFPIVQLARMPGGKSDSRATKRRIELLSAMDTLSSHMQTTFSALSTAIARRNSSPAGVNSPTSERASAHLVFVVGPSVGAARARVVFAVDGLEVKLWGRREDSSDIRYSGRGEKIQEGEDGESDEETEDEESDEESEDKESDEESEGGDSDEGSEDEDEEDEDDGYDEESNEGLKRISNGEGESEIGSETASEPPLSRSPSPSPSGSQCSRPSTPATPPVQSANHEKSPVMSSQTYAEEQQSLRAAERLLSRILANACAEENGGMSSPTQTHVLLRAPRRFVHPAWIPRQNLVRTMEGLLGTFLDEASATDTSREKKRGQQRGVRTEGVWIGCSESDISAGVKIDPETEAINEEDEMIWWAWDGKLVGFSDW
ncbi:uncharacterized protein FIBRA_06940 [Fibroporia radiculosa]|uniref:Uncharacterized protein n=1 Tax=Fibroporia radiculosa TaxID=599839 RepID=J4GTX7_9APHY|nr:uncharacterized protein FIBRA_06940 [Fibroporia radiculosa]CCM04750.1 predicted protein [Fibroporia radiculosa]